MAEWTKIEAQLRKTIDDMNVATNSSDTNIVDGVNRLIEGYKRGGADTSDATATENDIVVDTTAYVNGIKLEGQNPYKKVETDSEVQTQEELIDQILQELEGKALPSGTKSIYTNGVHNIAMYESVNVDVPIGVIPEGFLEIEENGEYPVAGLEGVIVDVPVGVFPEGVMEIDENGDYEVAEYAGVSVNVPVGVFPSGTKSITTNGTHDVTQYQSVNVNVAAPAGYAIKTGTTTARSITTGLSSIKQFFIYKEAVSSTGLINLHYSSDSGTVYVYASAWSTSNYGTKTITKGTTNATVSGGTLTIPSSSATSGGLSSNTTYKWVAIGEA